MFAYKLFCYGLGTLVLVFVGVQLWFLAEVLYWGHYQSATSAFMDQRLETLRARNPKAFLRHQWVPYDRISVHLKRAVVAAEDDGALEVHRNAVVRNPLMPQEGFRVPGAQRFQPLIHEGAGGRLVVAPVQDLSQKPQLHADEDEHERAQAVAEQLVSEHQAAKAPSCHCGGPASVPRLGP